MAGGKGTRLGGQFPKPMAVVQNRPFLEWLLLMLRDQVDSVIISTGYMAQIIEDYLGNGKQLGMNLSYSRENIPLGTAGAIKHALSRMGDRILVLNGDSWCHVNVKVLLAKHLIRRAAVTLWLVPSQDCDRYGNVSLDGDRIVEFTEKSTRGPGLINAGVYLLERSIVESIPDGYVSLEKDVFPRITNIYGVLGELPFIDIGTPESLEQAQVFRFGG